ncbi:hypothetical protein JCM11491_002644 [Sporobolomyces phaffii]
MSVHQEYRLFISDNAYTLIGDHHETLTIDRATASISLQPGAALPKRADQELTVFGIFGIISLLKADYLIVITKRHKVTRILSTPVYSATDFAVYPIQRSASSSPAEHLKNQPEEAYLLGLIKSHLYSAPFYFTYGNGYNLTMRLQQQAPDNAKPLWETSDDRFFWNKHLHQKLIDATTSNTPQDLSKFILPVMFGFLEFKTTAINGRQFQFGLISRRNRYRAGTRYFSRGIDQNGNVSNFNETEQLVLLDKEGGADGGRRIANGHAGDVRGEVRFSFVQTRGSVPVYWAEINNLRYKPDLKIMDLSSTIESLSRHFDQQISLYGSQILVNLVNQKGYEKPVKEAYERAVDGLKNDRLHYVYFDFHHECKGLRFDRVSSLIDGLDQELNKQAYFYHDTTSSPQAQIKQTSVVRTNCMDCLDRTNVVQSALAKWVLNNQLREIGVLSVKESVDEHAQFLNLFRNIWADNADTVSKAYSGTGALKTDYTRTGKRSKEGALQDGINSLMRYVKNNFLDGPRQDAYDLVTGTWRPRRASEVTIGASDVVGAGDVGDWLRDKRDLAARSAPWVVLATVTTLFLIALFPTFISQYVASLKKLALFAIVLLAVATHSILNNGIDYVAHPRLMRSALDDVLNYSGNGYESGRRGRPLRSHQQGSKSSSKLVSVEQSAKHRQLKKERKESILPMLSSSSASQGTTKLD